MYLAVKKGIFYNILLLTIFFTDYCHIYPAVYLLDKIYVSRAIVDTAPELYQKGDFPLKRDERHFVCVLELMLTLDKMLNISTLMCKKSKSEQRILKVIQSFHPVCIVLYIRYSGPVIGSSTAYILIIFRPSTTQTLRTRLQNGMKLR